MRLSDTEDDGRANLLRPRTEGRRCQDLIPDECEPFPGYRIKGRNAVAVVLAAFFIAGVALLVSRTPVVLLPRREGGGVARSANDVMSKQDDFEMASRQELRASSA